MVRILVVIVVVVTTARVAGPALTSASRRLQVTNVQSGDTIEDDADVLVVARGILSDPSWPQIPGLDGFQGQVMHSARWNHECDPRAVG